jgi:hypothetical protein
MPEVAGRTWSRGQIMAAARAAMILAVLALVGCSAPVGGSTAIADEPSGPPASGAPTAAPSASATLAATSPDPSPAASFAAATPTPIARRVPSAPPDSGIRTFPASDGDCDGMAVDDPLTLTLDLSQSERDAAMLTDRTDWNVFVVWPEGFTVARRGDEPVLLDDRGEIVGRQGDDVTIPKTVIYPAGGFEEPIVAEGVLFGRCHRRAVEFPSGSVVRTTDDGLRVRTAPGTGAESQVVHAGLPSGSSLFVLDGPVSDDGHVWYRVEWLDAPRPIPVGWVAADDLDGRRFVEADTLNCPSEPTIPSDIARLAHGYRVGCFAAEPLAIRARLVACECDVDGRMEPAWLTTDYGPGGPWLLIDPTAARQSPTLSEDLFLIRHPDSPSPDSLGGALVLVTGMFDHPDAAGCATPVGDGPLSPADCSAIFVVTAMEPA